MVSISTIVKFTALGLLSLTNAHPGEEEHSLIPHHAKREFLSRSRRSLDSCAEHLERRGIYKAAEARRKAFAEKHSKRSFENSENFLRIRDTASVLNTSHHSDLTGITYTTDECVFYSSNVSCILSPEGEIGPFWVKGELVRSDLTDNEPGVVVYMDAQFIDINTCETLPDVYWDVWNCNTTGVYSGIQSSSNGNGNDTANLNRTALRGIQKTDADGVAQFKSIFPGHYSGRTNHVHVVAHLNATLLPNSTLTGGSIPHIGQLFFDQDLISLVEATAPYNTNTNQHTLNSEDHVFAVETVDGSSDPVFQYVLLGDTVADGIFAWATIGVNTTASYDTSYAATLTSSGGVLNGNSSVGGGPGSAPSGSGVPSGTPSGIP
ncbi:putative extracellular dioxygenase [Cenococcum geophilum]